MKTYIKSFFLLSLAISFFILCATNSVFAQDTDRQVNKVSLEELYAIPNNQNAWLKYTTSTEDIFFCNPGDLDNLSLSYFCHHLKKSNKNILQVKRNALTHILMVVCTPKSLTEKELHETVGNIRKDIATILKTEKNPYAFMEEKCID